MEIVTVPRMARRLGVTCRWLTEMIEAGRVPALRAGRHRWLCEPEAVTAALARLAADGNSAPASAPTDGGKP